MTEIIEDLKKLLHQAVVRNPYKNLLFSGGLDTSILASLRPKLTGITISFGDKAEDIHYSSKLSRLLKIEHFHRKVDIDEAQEAIPEVIKILKSFDPAIPNDLVVYFGLLKAEELKIREIATGDASDELFGGYSFMQEMDDLESYIRRISQNLKFNSNDLGDYFGIKIIQPFVDRDVLNFALKIPKEFKIRQGKGKWILRKAFEGVLPQEVAWQNKRPLEYGSGFNRIREIISNKISDEEFAQRPPLMKFISKEHFYYYKAYRQVVGEIPKAKEGQVSCPGCGAGMEKERFHCQICGYVMDWRVK